MTGILRAAFAGMTGSAFRLRGNAGVLRFVARGELGGDEAHRLSLVALAEAGAHSVGNNMGSRFRGNDRDPRFAFAGTTCSTIAAAEYR